MKEYNIKINISVEATDSDYNRVDQYAQEIADAILQDENLTYDSDIQVVDVVVEEVQSLSEYDIDDYSSNDEDDD